MRLCGPRARRHRPSGHISGADVSCTHGSVRKFGADVVIHVS